ncbi:winged helix-turn-helix transcriptional regulator [Ruegeria sp. SCSIO 43209]|uniref:ArsR/SmtB family transcription factor n=1 Tax=Ruegeria sp. SCSIO 43209 TaxID=2793010 RepID=UPI001CA7CF6A|nr:helix-turn-helix domain-containing protein [Ruegeria sp. SCSIO 43209]UAB88182.1 winged helix-turn-helix transcriptional regulator [Ruegeria sp. SCSIO 43209]
MSVHFDPQLSILFNALGDTTRLLILEELRKRHDQTLFELCARLLEEHSVTISRQGITRHLNTLEQAGLITTTWRGRTKIHTLVAAPIADAINPWVDLYSQGDAL